MFEPLYYKFIWVYNSLLVMGEGPPKINPTRGYLIGLLNSRDALKQPTHRAGIERTISGFTGEEAEDAAAFLLRGLGVWQKDQRTRALELLPLLPFREKVPPEQLIRIYMGTVRSQPQDANPFGSIIDLLDAGIGLAQFFPQTQQTRSSLGNLWRETGERLSNQEGWKSVSGMVDELVSAIGFPRDEIKKNLIQIRAEKGERLNALAVAAQQPNFSRAAFARQWGVSTETVTYGLQALLRKGSIPALPPRRPGSSRPE